MKQGQPSGWPGLRKASVPVCLGSDGGPVAEDRGGPLLLLGGPLGLVLLLRRRGAAALLLRGAVRLFGHLFCSLRLCFEIAPQT